MILEKFENNILNCKIGCFIDKDNNNIYFRGKDIANALGYENTAQAIIINVDDDDKQKLEELWGMSDRCLTFNEKNTLYINESGLYSLILKSNKPEAKQFKKWITSEVLPSIRKNGYYNIPKVPQLIITNEKELHYNIINFMKDIINEPIIIAGLGENQINASMRIDSFRKGYQSGQPDIILLNYHIKYNGLAIELKTPKHNFILNDNQQYFLNKLENNNYYIIVSNSYNHIIKELIKYNNGIRYMCNHCKRHFKTTETRDKHYKYFHKIII